MEHVGDVSFGRAGIAAELRDIAEDLRDGNDGPLELMDRILEVAKAIDGKDE